MLYAELLIPFLSWLLICDIISLNLPQISVTDHKVINQNTWIFLKI